MDFRRTNKSLGELTLTKFAFSDCIKDTAII